jgi:hypothetical protein
MCDEIDCCVPAFKAVVEGILNGDVAISEPVEFKSEGDVLDEIAKTVESATNTEDKTAFFDKIRQLSTKMLRPKMSFGFPVDYKQRNRAAQDWPIVKRGLEFYYGGAGQVDAYTKFVFPDLSQLQRVDCVDEEGCDGFCDVQSSFLLDDEDPSRNRVVPCISKRFRELPLFTAVNLEYVSILLELQSIIYMNVFFKTFCHVPGDDEVLGVPHRRGVLLEGRRPQDHHWADGSCCRRAAQTRRRNNEKTEGKFFRRIHSVASIPSHEFVMQGLHPQEGSAYSSPEKDAFRAMLDASIDAIYPPHTEFSYAADIHEFHSERRAIMIGE